MKWNSIRTKVLAALLGCLVVGVGGILAMMRYGFERNSQALAAESVIKCAKAVHHLASPRNQQNDGGQQDPDRESADS
jgi:hypothetical protein